MKRKWSMSYGKNCFGWKSKKHKTANREKDWQTQTRQNLRQIDYSKKFVFFFIFLLNKYSNSFVLCTKKQTKKVKRLEFWDWVQVFWIRFKIIKFFRPLSFKSSPLTHIEPCFNSNYNWTVAGNYCKLDLDTNYHRNFVVVNHYYSSIPMIQYQDEIV
jgi:hypothetical protein